MKQVQISITAQAGRQFVPYLQKHLRRAAGGIRTSLRELSVALVGDARMAQLHERHLGIAGPTDVLSFELDINSRGRPISGEVVVCVGEARRRAGRSDRALARELLLYALHGMLHLSGFDDRTPWQFRKMHRTEDRILTELGVGPVFTKEAGTKTGAARQARSHKNLPPRRRRS